MLPVVIGTNPERGDWADDCVASIRATSSRRRVYVHRDGGYELTALRAGMARFKRFVFLHDSCEVLDPAFWRIVDNAEPSWFFGGPPMYLSIYDSNQLGQAITTAPTGEEITKRAAIEWEGLLPLRLPMPTIWPEVHDGTGRFEQHHGRQNLVLENTYLRKWKGNWGQGGV